MNQQIQRAVDVTGSYAPLVSEEVLGTFEISTPPTNGSNVFFLGDDGGDVPWVPGEYHEFKEIDLRTIQVKGTAPDIVTVVGGSW